MRAWRSEFGALRKTRDIAALQDVLAQAPALVRSVHELPSQEVAGDVLILVEAVSKLSLNDADDRRVCQLVGDVICSIHLEFGSASANKICGFLRGIIENKECYTKECAFDAVNTLVYFLYVNGQHLSAEEANVVLLSLITLMVHQCNVPKGQERPRNGLDSSVFVAVANLFIRAGSVITKVTWETVVQAFRKVLDHFGIHLLEDPAASRYYAAVLRSLHLILADIKGSLGDNVGGLVAALRMFLAYGLSGSRINSTNRSSASSSAPSKEIPKSKGSSLYRPPHLRNRLQDVNGSGASGSTAEEIERTIVYSDSEQSDNDGSLKIDLFRSSKARINAILCIQAIARADPKALHAYWSLLLPTHNVLQPRFYQPTLLTTLIFDPSSKARVAAASAVSAMLEGPVKAFLQVADYKETAKTGSFTTLSCSLGQIIVQLYRALLHSVSNEAHGGVLIGVFKALSLLVSSSPFDRLPAGLLLDVINTLHKRIFELPSSEQTLVLNCLSAALGASSGSSEVLNVLSETPQTVTSAKSIFLHLISLVKDSPSVLRIEALQALKTVVHAHSPVASLYWSSISALVEEVIMDEKTAYDEKAVHHGLKLLDESLRAICGFKGADDMFDAPTSSPFSNVEGTSADFHQWLEAMNKFLPLVLQHPAPVVRAAALTCFAGLTPAVYFSLSDSHQTYILSTVINAAVNDETPSVRSAACRALGVVVGCSEVIGRNERIITAVATIQTTISDVSLSVRITSCWALANVCDAFCKCFEKGITMVSFDPELVTTLADTALRAAKDGDKVRANAARALGNLAKFVDFSKSWNSSWLGKMVQTLVSCITTGNVKVQWNVCHALGNLFLNKTICLSTMTWSSSVFSILLLLLRDSGNFKIRIHAASALSVPSSRQDFGDSYGDVVHGLIHAMESLESENSAPSSFKYISTLSEQLTDTLLRVLCFALPEDYETLRDTLHKRVAFVRNWLESVIKSFKTFQDMEVASVRQNRLEAARQAVHALENVFEYGKEDTLREKFQTLLIE